MKGIFTFISLLFIASQIFAQSHPSGKQSKTYSSEIISDSFEFGYGNWNDGGADCEISMGNSSSGVYGIKLKDNSGIESSVYSNPLDLCEKESVNIKFKLRSYSMELNEKLLLEISLDGGKTFEIVEEWLSGKQFENEKFIQVSQKIAYDFTDETVFRFRCEASSNKDHIYLDEIEIHEGKKSTGSNFVFLSENITTSQINFNSSEETIDIFPNPARDFFSLNLTAVEGQSGTIEIYNLVGAKLSRSIFKENHSNIIDVPIEYLENGYYSVCVKSSSNKLHVMRLMVSR